MLSVLIPTFDEDVASLVRGLWNQAQFLEPEWEIIISDQCPDGKHTVSNQSLSQLEHVNYHFWNEKPGRSANRNHLADLAGGEWLLFLDSDSDVISDSFLSDFWEARESGKVICGQMFYRPEDPGPEFRLRWKYGRAKEMTPASIRNKHPYKSFISFAFLIGSADFNKVRFDESIVEYGHEDTLFGKHLKHHFILPKHTDIPLLHTGLISAPSFMEKVDQSIRSLELLCKTGKADEDFRMYAVQQRLARFKGDLLLAWWFRAFKTALTRNLLGPKPSLFLMDLYKLGYFCTLRRGVKTSAKTLRS